MERSPPDGNDDASASPPIRFLPLNAWMARAVPAGSMKELCFSAVPPVRGWNQCVKCVAPLERAHSFIACATSAAMDGSSGLPSFTVARSFAAADFGRKARISFSPNTSSPYVCSEVSAGSVASGTSGRRSAIAFMAWMRLFVLMAS